MEPDEPFWMKPYVVILKDGTEVTLRPERVEDLEPTWEMFSSLSDATLEFLPIPFDRERVEGWFKNIDYSKNLPILGFVETDKGVRVVSSSSLSFHEQEVYRHRAEFGVTVHDDYQNLGLGTILTGYMLDIAKERGLKKVDLMVVAHNTRAIKVYERLGFVVEGLLKMNHWNHIRNEYCDEYKMGKTLD